MKNSFVGMLAYHDREMFEHAALLYAALRQISVAFNATLFAIHVTEKPLPMKLCMQAKNA